MKFMRKAHMHDARHVGPMDVAEWFLVVAVAVAAAAAAEYTFLYFLSARIISNHHN